MLKLFMSLTVMLALAAPGWAQTPKERDAGQDRQQVANFAGELRQAIMSGAGAMLRQVKAESPRADLILAGSPQVQYLNLDQGPVFSVEVPSMRPNNVWALMEFAGQKPVRRAPQGERGAVTPTGFGPTAPAAGASPPPVPVPSPYIDPDLVSDPDAVYTREVKAALIDAMLLQSKGLRLAPGQTLTVAARDDARPDPRFPSSSAEFQTVYFTVKGSDLAAFHEKRLTLEEARKLVTIRED